MGGVNAHVHDFAFNFRNSLLSSGHSKRLQFIMTGLEEAWEQQMFILKGEPMPSRP